MAHCFAGSVSAEGLSTPMRENASTASIIASGLWGGSRGVCRLGVDAENCPVVCERRWGQLRGGVDGPGSGAEETGAEEADNKLIRSPASNALIGNAVEREC
jgi:hypothetical protein